VRTSALALELLASGAYPTAGLLSHLFPLSRWREAFGAAFDKRASGSVKVAFDLR
jgi:threonine dehydrogenase-like Zn-dependent dehydrogenase